jgi:hypothetical protein
VILVHPTLIPVLLAVLALVGLRIVLARLSRVAVLARALSGRRWRLPVTCRGYACDGEAEHADQNGEGECRQLLLHFGPSPGCLLVFPSPRWWMTLPRLESLVRVYGRKDPSFRGRDVTANDSSGRHLALVESSTYRGA